MIIASFMLCKEKREKMASMDWLEDVEQANIDKAFIDAYPPGIRVEFNC
jgi:hypothetical protein